jgi:hypothetical protein
MGGELMKRRQRTAVAVLALAAGVMAWSNPALAVITQVDNVVTATGTTSPFSLSFTVSSSANVLVLMIDQYAGNNPSASSVGYNGKAMTLAVNQPSKVPTIREVAIWYLFNPDSGTHSITGTCAGASARILGAFTMSGVDTNQSPSANGYDNEPALSTSVVVTNAAGAWEVAVQAAGDTSGTFSWTASLGGTATSLFQGTGSSTAWGAGVIKGLISGTNTITGTYSGTTVGGKDPMAVACFAAAPSSSFGPTVDNAPGIGATNVLATSSYLNGTLTSTGTAPTHVWVYWGANNMGANKTWAYTNDFGNANQPTGALTYAASGLSSNTTYWYTYYASNSVSDAWGSPSTFATLGMPVIDNNGGASSVGATTVTLNGALRSGSSSQILIAWGTVSNALATTNNFGTRNIGTFSTNLTGLARATTYYYSCYASNAVGVVWSAIASFSTLNNITWTNTAFSGSWSNAAVWDYAPLFNGTENAFVGGAAPAYGTTYTLDGNRFINSLTFQNSETQKLFVAPGTPANSLLTLKSGNIVKGSPVYDTISAGLRIDDGANPANGVWSIYGQSLTISGNIYGLPQSSITVTNIGSTVLILSTDNTATFGGTWFLNPGTVELDAAGSFGSGTAQIQNFSSVYTLSALTVTNPLVLAGGYANFYTANNNTLSLTGPISGPGTLYPGSYLSTYMGAIRLGSTNITATGGVDFLQGCPLVVTGAWSNCGNITLRSAGGNGASLQGNGVIGMGMSNTLGMVYVAGYTNFIAPGNGTPLFTPTNSGAIGTLTIGTPGNHNSVTFGQGSAFVVDVTNNSSDQLVVNGAVNFNNTGNQLNLFGTLRQSTTYTLMTYTGWDTGKFASVYLNNVLVATPTNKAGVNSTHTLVYGPASLQLVGSNPGTVMFLR